MLPAAQRHAMIGSPGLGPACWSHAGIEGGLMVWFILLHLVGFLVDLLTATRRPDHDKDLQILVLQHQLRLLQRERPQPPRLTRWEKLALAVLTAKLASSSAGPRARLDHLLLLFKPETVLKWHRELIRRTWT